MQFIEPVAGNLANSFSKSNRTLNSYSFCQQLFAKVRKRQDSLKKPTPASRNFTIITHNEFPFEKSH